MSVFRSPEARERSRTFIRALKTPKDAGFSPWAVYTHACHETGFFAKVIGQANYWGIKPGKSWKGPVHNVLTHEFICGENRERVEAFADWDTTEEALAFYCALIERLYKDSFKCRACHECFIRNLTAGEFKWATDPNYTDKLLALYAMVRREEEIAKDFEELLPVS